MSNNPRAAKGKHFAIRRFESTDSFWYGNLGGGEKKLAIPLRSAPKRGPTMKFQPF